MAADHRSDVHAAVNLTASPQVISTEIDNPPTPRALSVTIISGTLPVTGTLPISGTREGGAVVTETITLTGKAASTVTQFASVLFDTVVSFTLPVKTNASGDSISLGLADALFTVAEARAYGAACDSAGDPALASVTSYPDATIEAAEAAIREQFELICQVRFIPTETTELLDATDSKLLRVGCRNPLRERPPRPLEVSAVTLDDTAFVAGDLADLAAYPDGRIVRKGGDLWSAEASGENEMAVEITYTHGWASVPGQIKQSALKMAVATLVSSDIPDRATAYENIQLAFAGPPPHWTGIPTVDAALDLYRERRIVVA